LPFLVGIGRHTKQEREMIKLPPFQYSVIVGLLLSDGWLIFASATNKNARLGIADQKSINALLIVLFILIGGNIFIV